MNTLSRTGLVATAPLLLTVALGPRLHASGATARAVVRLPAAHVALVYAPAIHLGADKKMHDAATPTDLTAVVGQRVIVTAYNYDTGQHSFTAPSLHLNVTIRGATRTGVPAVTTFAFTASQAGTYAWHCVIPCDDQGKGWAMSHQGYLAGQVTITATS